MLGLLYHIKGLNSTHTQIYREVWHVVVSVIQSNDRLFEHKTKSEARRW